MGLVVWTITLLLLVLHFRSGRVTMSLLHAAVLAGWQILAGLISIGSQAAADMWVWLAFAGLMGSALAIPIRRPSMARNYRRAVDQEGDWQSNVHDRMNDGR